MAARPENFEPGQVLVFIEKFPSQLLRLVYRLRVVVCPLGPMANQGNQFPVMPLKFPVLFAKCVAIVGRNHP